MAKFKRLAALLLGLTTSACATVPPLASVMNARSTDGVVQAAAVSETAALFNELGATGPTLDPRLVAADDMAALDLDRDGQLESQEVSGYFASTLQQAMATPSTFGANDPSPVGPGALPQFFVNPVPQNNETDLMVDEAEIFPALFEMIRGAETKIQLDFFLLGGEIGLSIARVLAQKASEGVEINLMMDPKLGLGGPTAVGIAKVVNFLKQAKVNYRMYPLGLYGPMPNGMQKKFQIDHNKILVVDGRRALIGSMNLDDGARMNHDLMVKVEGPTAAEISKMLGSEWAFGIDPNKPAQLQAPSLTQGPMRIQALSQMRLTQTAPQERTTRDLLLRELNAAQRSIHVAMYEFGDPQLTKALTSAYKRGVDVRVLMDDKAKMEKYGAAVAPDGMPNILPARELLKAGAQVRWFASTRAAQELHMKMVVIDGNKVVAGSTNWTTNALTRWRETSFVIEGGTAAKCQSMFLNDWQHNSRRVDKLKLRQRIVARVVDYMNRHDLAFW